MKNIILSLACVLITGIIFGQTIQTRNLVSVHVGTVILDPNVTFNQWKNNYTDTYIPAINKEFQGEIQIFLAEGNRGADVNCVAQFLVFKSMEVRDKYFPKEGAPSELFMSKIRKLQVILDEVNKLGTFSEKHYTDWDIQ